jgi:hypothetical protein
MNSAMRSSAAGNPGVRIESRRTPTECLRTNDTIHTTAQQQAEIIM